jgi:hypothetical protein
MVPVVVAEIVPSTRLWSIAQLFSEIGRENVAFSFPVPGFRNNWIWILYRDPKLERYPDSCATLYKSEDHWDPSGPPMNRQRTLCSMSYTKPCSSITAVGQCLHS